MLEIRPQRKNVFAKTVSFVLMSLLIGSMLLRAQSPAKKPEPQQGMGGVSTGTPLTYTSRRTVGITDPKAPVVFEDVTDKTAMADFRHRSGGPQKIGRASCRERV